MDEKRICDYFVIAGLPDPKKRVKQNAFGSTVKNSNNSQNYNIFDQNYKPLDPITDITIIITNLKEKVPEGWFCIENTPYGNKANLNHGSIKSPTIYLCYKRGIDKPPLVDIGVLFDSKDEIMSDSKIVLESYYGNNGNINNGQSKTFLTYRRAKPSGPCNQLVVTDICVILKNHGEIPPKSFCLINKKLNKGLVGSDVYICYKKSMSSPPLLRFTPSIIDRYPKEDLDCYSLPESIAMFCLPLGSTIECWPKDNSSTCPSLSTFVLTSNYGTKVYGVALTFYEKLQLGEYDTLTNEELKKLKYFSGFEQISKKLLVNKSICILSRWPFFDLFEEFLHFLHNMIRNSTKVPLKLPLEVYISHFMMNVPFPSISRPKIMIQLSSSENDILTLSNPSEEVPLSLSGANYANFLQYLGPNHSIQVFLLALTEQKILIHSLNLDALTSVAEALTSLIFPFHWQCPYIPLCPLALCDVLNAPLPFIVGVDSRYFDLNNPPSDIACVDLDTESLSISECKKYLNIKIMPRKAYKTLKKTLDSIYDQIVRMKHEYMDRKLVLTCKILNNHFGLEIQEAFLQFMAFILKDFRSYLLPITEKPTVGATDPSSLFNFDMFLSSQDRSSQPFYSYLMNTQMFTRFIEERSFISDKHTALAFFDDCLNKIESTIHSDSVRFIEIDEKVKNDRTVFISDPESLLNAHINKHKYKSFGPFNHDLFLSEPLFDHFNDRKSSADSKSIENLTDICSSNSNLNNSKSMIIRTKQEIRSAQRAAEKLAKNSLTWSKCLISYCYSLWFVHLHSYVKATQHISLQGKLKNAFNVLLRMQSLDLHPLDEVCYRILMLLSGIYSQPVLAVKILYEMKNYNVTPNAITYGYYNKAVLESEWTTSDKSVNVNWKKLRNVIFCIAELKRRVKLRIKKQEKLTNQPDTNENKQYVNKILRSSYKFNKNKTFFEDGIKKKTGILRKPFSSINGQKNLFDYSSIAGILINSEKYNKLNENKNNTLLTKRKKFKKQDFKFDQENGLRKTYFNNLETFKDSYFKSFSLNPYIYSKLNDNILKYTNNKTPIKKVTSLANHEEKNEKNFDENSLSNVKEENLKLKNQTNKKVECENIQNLRNNLQSDESLNNSELSFNPLKDALLNINLFSPDNKFTNSLRSSFRIAKNQFSNKGLFSSNLVKTLSSSGDQIDTSTIKAKTKAKFHELFKTKTEVIEQNNYDQNKVPLDKETLDRNLPDAMNSSIEKKQNESLLSQDNLLEEENQNNKMTKSQSTDLNSIWSTKFSQNKHIDYLNSTFKFATNRLYEFKSTLSSSTNNSPSRLQQNSNALLTNIGQNTSALISNIASIVKLPSNVHLTEYYETYLAGYENFEFPGFKESNSINNLNNMSSYDNNKLFDTLEQHYTKDIDSSFCPTILKIEMTSCSRCYNCLAILYDEEIMAKWFPDDSNLNTTCRYCKKPFVPELCIWIKYNKKYVKESDLIDFGQKEKNISDLDIFEDYEKISFNYLSPIVLRKELENIVESEGDFCLTNLSFLESHPIIYWNLIWYFKRVNLPTHLGGLYLMNFSIKNNIINNETVDYRNVSFVCLWDNEDLFVNMPKPVYHFWCKNYYEEDDSSTLIDALTIENKNFDQIIFKHLLDYIENDNLIEAIRIFLLVRDNKKTKKVDYYSIYRDLLYLSFAAFNKKDFDHIIFDRGYRHAYDFLKNQKNNLIKTDKAPSLRATFCRRCFKSLELKYDGSMY